MTSPSDGLTLSQRVVSFARGKMGQKVGAGECWDLAESALNSAGAKNSNDLTPDSEFARNRYVWGTEVSLENAQAGDIIQVNDLTIRITRSDSSGESWSENTFPFHTMIATGSPGPRGGVGVLHQNYENVQEVREGRFHLQSTSYTEGSPPNATRVTITVTGRIKVYRPEAR